MEEIVLSVPGMTCRHCVRAISVRVRDVVGVVAVEADLTSRTVRVQGTPQLDILRSAVADAGYEAIEVNSFVPRKESLMIVEDARTSAGHRRSGPHLAADRGALLEAWSNERAAARAARGRGDMVGEWGHLERAHILSQPMALPHIRTHLAMASCAVRRHDRREVAGQLLRLVLAGPGSLSGRYPVGNTGGADVSPFVPMSIPEDLRALLAGHEATEATR